MFRNLCLAVVGCALAACTVTPSDVSVADETLIGPAGPDVGGVLEDEADAVPWVYDRDADPADGAFGPPWPGYAGGFGESDWRYGAFTPPQVDPEPLFWNHDLGTQLESSPWGAKVTDRPLGWRDTDLFIMGTSADSPYDDEDGLGGVGAYVRIPF